MSSKNNFQVSEETRLKFNPNGSARHFPGVTVLCHLPADGSQSAIHDAIIKNCFVTESNELLRDYYVQLPAPSLHMTIFDAKVYKRSEADDSHSDTTSQLRAADMLTFRHAFLDPAHQSTLRANLPIKMTVDLSAARHATRSSPLTVPVKPYDETEASKLHAIRNALGVAFGMSSIVDPKYRFHITEYYSLRPLSAEQFDVLRRDWAEAVGRVAEAVPTFEIERVELCAFEDMCHFEVVESVGLD